MNELVDSAEKGRLKDKIYCVYISPLKALNYDIEVNLVGPLKEIEKIAEKICARDDIGDECVCSECINDLMGGYAI